MLYTYFFFLDNSKILNLISNKQQTNTTIFSFSYVCPMKIVTVPIYLEKDYDLFQIFKWWFAWFDLNQVCHLHLRRSLGRDCIDVYRTIWRGILFYIDSLIFKLISIRFCVRIFHSTAPLSQSSFAPSTRC